MREGIFWVAVTGFVTTVTILFVALFTNIVLRYLFDRGITWAYEIPYVLFPWMVATGAVVATVRGRNIQVKLLVNVLPAALARVCRIAVNAIVVATSVLVIWTSMPFLKASTFMRLAETGIPQVWGVSSLIYAFGMIALIAAMDIVLLVLDPDTLERGHGLANDFS